MSNTGLTDSEKESLLKFFLTHCVIEQIKDPETNLYPYKLEFFDTEAIHKGYGQLIGKAMTNLVESALGLN